MKHLATVALMFNLGAAGIYAQPGPAKITLSGTAAPSTMNLGPHTTDYRLAGNSTLGKFDLRAVSVSTPSPQQSGPCSLPNKLYLLAAAGGGVFRFENGDLLTVNLIGGDDCIDFSAGEALCTRIFQITAGTGRFKNASGGSITLTMTLTPVTVDASDSVFAAVTGGLTGMVPGVAMGQGSQDGQP